MAKKYVRTACAIVSGETGVFICVFEPSLTVGLLPHSFFSPVLSQPERGAGFCRKQTWESVK
jgi:hypothetical protein